MASALKVLHLEDEVADSLNVQELLSASGLAVQFERVATMPAFRQALEQEMVFDIILSDYSIPGMRALDALQWARAKCPNVPFLFVSGTIGEEQAIETLKMGATDYVLKQRLQRLVPAVRRALQEAEERSRLKAAETALRGSEARLNAIIASAMDAVISVDAQQRIVLFNPAAVQIFGVPESEALGQSLNRFIPERFRAAHTRHVQAFGEQGVTRRRMGALGDLTGLRANGEEFPIEASISQAEVHGQKLFTVILRDISERKQAEKALQEAHADLERKVEERTAQLLEANANLQTFAYTAAHDLRAPLRAIRGFSSLALEQSTARPGTPTLPLLERVTKATDQMDRLLSDLLEYSRLTQAEIKLEAVSLEKAVEEALALQESDIRAKDALVQVARPLPVVIGHPATLMLIISNYVANALKFTRPAVRPEITIRAEESAEYVRVSVQDNGIGIAAENLNKLFATFHRLHDKRTYPGTGLGLAIVKKGAERMGGQVGVESELGKGSQFWFRLPKRSVEDTGPDGDNHRRPTDTQ